MRLPTFFRAPDRKSRRDMLAVGSRACPKEARVLKYERFSEILVQLQQGVAAPEQHLPGSKRPQILLPVMQVPVRTAQ